MKRFFCFLAVFLFFLFYTATSVFVQTASADENKAEPVYILQNSGGNKPTTTYSAATAQLPFDWNRDEKGNPTSPIINGRVQFVQVTFQGIEKPEEGELYFCLRTNEKDCADGDNRGKLSLIKDSFNESAKTVTMIVCGRGEKNLKNWVPGKKPNDRWCNDKNHTTDYFHEGNYYTVRLYGSKTGNSLIDSISFFVKHSFPTFDPKTGATSDNPPFKTPSRIRIGFDNKNELSMRAGPFKKNAYLFALVKLGGGYQDFACGIFAPTQENPNYTFTNNASYMTLGSLGGAVFGSIQRKDNGGGGLGIGRYVLTISDWPLSNDNDILSCFKKGNFIYYAQLITIGKNGGTAQELIKDPAGMETEEELEKAPPAIPCNPGKANNGVDEGGNCKTVSTAIGPIDVDPQKFIASLFQRVLSIAGFAAIIIILIASYNLMFSGGNKEKIAGARETITAAVLGLLFIIFSIVLLKIIGVDILRIPGFK